MIAPACNNFNATSNNNSRPARPKLYIDRISPDLDRSARRWVCWKYKWRNGAWTKVPINGLTGGYAKANDPSTWHTFDVCYNTWQHNKDIDGIGYQLGDGIIGIDKDDCLVDGVLATWADEIVKRTRSYTEISPSGIGLKTLLKGIWLEEKGRSIVPFPGTKLEVYPRRKYFTLTGNQYGDLTTINEAQDAIDWLYSKYFRSSAKVVTEIDYEIEPCTEDDAKIIEALGSQTNGWKFKRLWEGVWEGDYGSQSEAEMALVSLIAFRTGPDPDAIDRIFRKSKLTYMGKQKWLDRPDYRKMTIDHVLGNPDKDYYKPKVDLIASGEHLFDKSEVKIEQVAALSLDAGEKTEPTISQAAWSKLYSFNPISAEALNTMHIVPQWLIKGIMVKNQPCIMGGPKKVLKTSIITDLALSLGSGCPFLGKFAVPRKVRTILISGESGDFTIQDTARRVCHSKGIELKDCDTFFDFRLPKVGSSDELKRLAEGIYKHQMEVVIIDPMYLCLLAGQTTGREKQASNLFHMGEVLAQVSEAIMYAGGTPLLIHHCTKPSGFKTEPLDLEDLAFAGVAEYARQWMLISRREKFVHGSGHHELFFVVGGSAGQSGMWGLDINEGVLQNDFGGRKWEVMVRKGADLLEEKKAQKQSLKMDKDTGYQTEFLNAMGDKPVFIYHVKTQLGWNDKKFSRIQVQLVETDKIKDKDINGKPMWVKCG